MEEREDPGAQGEVLEAAVSARGRVCCPTVSSCKLSGDGLYGAQWLLSHGPDGPDAPQGLGRPSQRKSWGPGHALTEGRCEADRLSRGSGPRPRWERGLTPAHPGLCLGSRPAPLRLTRRLRESEAFQTGGDGELGPRMPSRGAQADARGAGKLGGVEVGVPWRGRPHCLAPRCRLPFPGLPAAGGGHVGGWPRVTRASHGSHVLG